MYGALRSSHQKAAVLRELREAVEDDHWGLAWAIVDANPDLGVRIVANCDGSWELVEEEGERGATRLAVGGSRRDGSGSRG